MSNESRDQLLRRVQGEYLEMPGLQLTLLQAQRLWALDPGTCTTILDVLVDRRFLICGDDHRYRRVSDGHAPEGRPRTAKADLTMRIPTERVG